VPLFSGYLFARCRPQRQLQAVRYCPGVLGPVVFDGEPASVSQRLIDELKEREGERGFVLPPELEVGFRAGQRVRLMTGPLKGLEGVFGGYLRGGQRAQVLLHFLRAEHRVEVDTQALAMARC
jgi:transcription antitermination factor NusG